MKILKIYFLITVVAVVAIIVSGCAASVSSNSFPRSATRTTFDVYYGEVVAVRAVEIEGDTSYLGESSGALIGQAVGLGDSRWFSGSRRLEGAIGAVGGSIAGAVIERKVRREDGLEIVVTLDHNETIAVVQGSDVVFDPGERVRVLIGRDGSTRVQPL